MATPTDDQLREELKLFVAVLAARQARVAELDNFYEGDHPLPPLVQQTGTTKAYRSLMALAVSNWPKLVVDSCEERLEVQGLRFGSKDADAEVWDLWQQNGLDAESSTLHQSALTTGRAYAIVWTDPLQPDTPSVTYEHASMCAVRYVAGSRRERASAIRLWRDDDKLWRATLYRPEALYKFKAQMSADGMPSEGVVWDRREVRGEPWPLPNPLQQVPVVEFAVNRGLRPARFGRAAGDFEANVNHVNRINYKVFCGLVALTWSGFPLRALIGDPILKDDDGKPIQPFDVLGNSVVQIENKDGKLVQLPAADIGNFSPEMDVKHLGALTKTPPHYLLGEMANLSADAIRAAEAGLIRRTKRHQRPLGEAHEDTSRLMLMVKKRDDPRAKDPNAEVIWADPESRSLAERADAAAKLKDVLPWQAVAQVVMQATPQQIRRWQADRTGEALANALGIGAGAPAPATPATQPSPGANGQPAG